jgi:hypothetical protein
MLFTEDAHIGLGQLLEEARGLARIASHPDSFSEMVAEVEGSWVARPLLSLEVFQEGSHLGKGRTRIQLLAPYQGLMAGLQGLGVARTEEGLELPRQRLTLLRGSFHLTCLASEIGDGP